MRAPGTAAERANYSAAAQSCSNRPQAAAPGASTLCNRSGQHLTEPL